MGSLDTWTNLLGLPNLVHKISREFAKHAYTMHLFTKSDIKTTLIPIACFAIATATELQLTNIPHSMLWVWIHLLQCDISNQILSPEEDQKNKNDRPLPAGRLTLRHARILRWTLVPICMLYSLCYSMESFSVSVVFSMFTCIYNEMRLNSGHWIIRNILVACGLSSLATGATLIANRDRSSLDETAILALCCDAAMVATTIHVQDFGDVVGDRAIGRRTLPITHPNFARLSVPALLIAWSVGLGYIWNLDCYTNLFLLGVAATTSFRFLWLRKTAQDKTSYGYWYNFWLSATHALPRYYRHFNVDI